MINAADNQAGSSGALGGALLSVTGGRMCALTKALGQLQGLGFDTSTSLLSEVVGLAKENAPPEAGQRLHQPSNRTCRAI